MTLSEALVPRPKEISKGGGSTTLPREVNIAAPGGASPAGAIAEVAGWLQNDLWEVCQISCSPHAAFHIQLSISPEGLRPEGYCLAVSPDGVSLTGHDPDALFWGAQTLMQIAALCGPSIPCVTITDWPHYRRRAVMLDAGRAPYSAPLIRRVIRIMARLKLNSLHLHLMDDHLNAVRFHSLPLGSENPCSLPVEEYAAIVRYARRWHISVMPEFECWGHAGSVLYHYPQLYGAPGMWDGFSFGIGEELYGLFEKMMDEFVPALEPVCDFHVGLDEANWALLPSVPESRRELYSPTEHVARLYDILQRVGARHGRQIRMNLWADHGGRPLPHELEDKVVVSPWVYCEAQAADIREKVQRYSGQHKAPFMMGAGMSRLHMDGHYGATRIWCREGKDSPNCEGVTLCMWESNNVAGRILGFYGGADCAWVADVPGPAEDDLLSERERGLMRLRMRRWQNVFRDADPDAINLDRGQEALSGLWCWGPHAGKPVAPTAAMRDPRERA